MWELLEGFFDVCGDAFVRNYLNAMYGGIADEKMSEQKRKRFKRLISYISVTLFFAFIFGLFFFVEGTQLMRNVGVALMIASVASIILYIAVGYIVRFFSCKNK